MLWSQELKDNWIVLQPPSQMHINSILDRKELEDGILRDVGDGKKDLPASLSSKSNLCPESAQRFDMMLTPSGSAATRPCYKR